MLYDLMKQKNIRSRLVYFIVIALILVLIILYLPFSHIKRFDIEKVCIKSKCFSVELAQSPSEREQGLSYRSNLDEDKGMLFIFQQPMITHFWMKDTLIPLDIIWINDRNEIIYLEKNAQPCNIEPCKLYGPDKPSKYVLEINANLSEKYGFSIGDKISWKK